jgi:hypothetical protein
LQPINESFFYGCSYTIHIITDDLHLAKVRENYNEETWNFLLASIE